MSDNAASTHAAQTYAQNHAQVANAQAANAHAGTQAHGGPDHGAGGGFPPFDTRNFSSQIVWLAITFGLLYLLMSRIALPRIGAILRDRESRIAADLEAARAAQAKAEAARILHEKTLAEAKASALALGQTANQQMAAEAEARRKSLEADLSAKMSAAEAKIAATKAQAMTNVDAVAKDAAAAIIERLTGKTTDLNLLSQAIASVTKG